MRVCETAQRFVYLDSLAHAAEPHLRAARDALNETVQLAVLDGIDNVYIAKVEADHPLRLVSRVGMRLPAYATGLGKVLLAHLDPADLEPRLKGVTIRKFTQHTIATPQQLFERDVPRPRPARRQPMTSRVRPQQTLNRKAETW